MFNIFEGDKRYDTKIILKLEKYTPAHKNRSIRKDSFIQKIFKKNEND